MKRIILATMVMTIGLFACAQTPPKQGSDAFSEKFSDASEVKWEQEKENEWEAEFKLNGKETSANFDAKGVWQETEFVISKKEISAEAHKAINLKFEGWKIEKVESIETPDFKGYEIALEKEDTETEISVTTTGEITILKVKVEDDDDERED